MISHGNFKLWLELVDREFIRGQFLELPVQDHRRRLPIKAWISTSIWMRSMNLFQQFVDHFKVMRQLEIIYRDGNLPVESKGSASGR